MTGAAVGREQNDGSSDGLKGDAVTDLGEILRYAQDDKGKGRCCNKTLGEILRYAQDDKGG
jgi:hypothetical protein